MPVIDTDILQMLDSAARRINSPSFIADDPVQFPRRFDRLQDIEIAALLTATISWGNRRMICRDADRMLALMGHDPYHYLLDEGYEDLPDANIHRTFFTANLRHYLRGLRNIYTRYGSLQEMVRHERIAQSPMPAWDMVDHINRYLAEANGGCGDSRCLPLNLRTTALKRVNMALRWLVRNDGIVDLGVWDCLTPAQLYIPLDVHVGNTARDLGLLSRRSNDRQAVIELTDLFRRIRPDDPVWYDYALFGIGIENKYKDTSLNNTSR